MVKKNLRGLAFKVGVEKKPPEEQTSHGKGLADDSVREVLARSTAQSEKCLIGAWLSKCLLKGMRWLR